MLKVRLFLPFHCADGLAILTQDAELPVLFPGLELRGFCGEDGDDADDIVKLVRYDRHKDQLTAILGHGGGDDTTISELRSSSFYGKWRVEDFYPNATHVAGES